jgi:hypothetical protein
VFRGTYCVKESVLVACLPYIDWTLANEVEENVRLTTTRECFDLAELNPNPFGFDSLLPCTKFNATLHCGLGPFRARRNARVSYINSARVNPVAAFLYVPWTKSTFGGGRRVLQTAGRGENTAGYAAEDSLTVSS